MIAQNRGVGTDASANVVVLDARRLPGGRGSVATMYPSQREVAPKVVVRFAPGKIARPDVIADRASPRTTWHRCAAFLGRLAAPSVDAFAASLPARLRADIALSRDAERNDPWDRAAEARMRAGFPQI